MFLGPRFFFADTSMASAYPSISQDVLTAMAAQGTKTEPGGEQSIPDVKVDSKEAPEEAPQTQSPVAAPEPPKETVAAPAPVEKVGIPAPAPVEEKAAEAPPTISNWKDTLKTVDAADILKELGYDDKMVGFFNKWRSDGNINEYLKAATVDFGKMTPEQLMRYHLEEQFPEFSAEDLEELYQAKVVEQYKLDPNTYSEIEVRRGKLMLQADAKTVRGELIHKQQDYILSAKPPAPAVDTSAQQWETEREQLRSQYSTYLTNNQATKDLLTNKRLVLGDGENAFNYGVADPQLLLTVLQQPEQYARHVFQEDGSPFVDKQLFIAAAAIDYKGLVNQLVNYGRELGAKGIVDQMDNASKSIGEQSKGETGPVDPAKELAKSGVIVSYS